MKDAADGRSTTGISPTPGEAPEECASAQEVNLTEEGTPNEDSAYGSETEALLRAGMSEEEWQDWRKRLAYDKAARVVVGEMHSQHIRTVTIELSDTHWILHDCYDLAQPMPTGIFGCVVATSKLTGEPVETYIDNLRDLHVEGDHNDWSDSLEIQKKWPFQTWEEHVKRAQDTLDHPINWWRVEAIATALLERGTLTREDLDEIMYVDVKNSPAYTAVFPPDSGICRDRTLDSKDVGDSRPALLPKSTTH